MQTQYLLATLKKGTESITDYFHRAKSLAASLGTTGQPLSSSEFAVYLLTGLGTDYDPLVTSLTTRVDPLSPQQIYNFLLAHESRLSHQAQTMLATHNTLVKQPNTFTTSPRGRGSRLYRGRRQGGRQNTSSSSTRPDNSPIVKCITSLATLP